MSNLGECCSKPKANVFGLQKPEKTWLYLNIRFFFSSFKYILLFNYYFKGRGPFKIGDGGDDDGEESEEQQRSQSIASIPQKGGERVTRDSSKRNIASPFIRDEVHLSHRFAGNLCHKCHTGAIMDQRFRMHHVCESVYGINFTMQYNYNFNFKILSQEIIMFILMNSYYNIH